MSSILFPVFLGEIETGPKSGPGELYQIVPAMPKPGVPTGYLGGSVLPEGPDHVGEFGVEIGLGHQAQ
jgi:hypothetical protein